MRNPFVRRFANDGQAKTGKKDSSNEDPDERFDFRFSRAIAETNQEIALAKKQSFSSARKYLVPSTKPSPLHSHHSFPSLTPSALKIQNLSSSSC